MTAEQAPPLYTISANGERVWITCHQCGTASDSPHDVENLYCAQCHRFFAERPWRGRASVERTIGEA